MFRGVCEFCGKNVTTLDVAAFRIRAWEVERQVPVLRKERQPNRIVHELCLRSHLKKTDQMNMEI